MLSSWWTAKKKHDVRPKAEAIGRHNRRWLYMIWFWTQSNSIQYFSISWNWTVYRSFRAQDKPCINKKRNASWSLLICQKNPRNPSRTLESNQINTKIGSNKPQIKHIKRGWIILLNPSKNLQGWPSNFGGGLLSCPGLTRSWAASTTILCSSNIYRQTPRLVAWHEILHLGGGKTW